MHNQVGIRGKWQSGLGQGVSDDEFHQNIESPLSEVQRNMKETLPSAF